MTRMNKIHLSEGGRRRNWVREKPLSIKGEAAPSCRSSGQFTKGGCPRIKKDRKAWGLMSPPFGKIVTPGDERGDEVGAAMKRGKKKRVLFNSFRRGRNRESLGDQQKEIQSFLQGKEIREWRIGEIHLN